MHFYLLVAFPNYWICVAFSTSYSEVLICSVLTRFPYCGILMFLEQKSSIPKINWYSPMPKNTSNIFLYLLLKYVIVGKTCNSLLKGPKSSLHSGHVMLLSFEDLRLCSAHTIMHLMWMLFPQPNLE